MDSFEDQNLTEYSTTTDLSITQTFSTDGQYGLEYAGGNERKPVSTTGLSRYPSKPAEIRVDIQSSLGTSGLSNPHLIAAIYSAVDTSNWYMAQLRIDDPKISIWRHNGGFTSISTQSNPGNISANTTYTIVVQWDDGNTFGGSDGDMTFELQDSGGTVLATTTGNDTTLNDTGIGYRLLGESGEKLHADNYRITQ